MPTLFLIIVLVLSVVIHEVAHGYAAAFLGDPTARLAGRLTLNPFKHLDPIGSVILPGILILLGGFVIGWAKPVPYNPYNLKAGRWGPAAVAAAGPGTNLLLALVFGLISRGLATAGAFPLIASLCQLVVLINVMLAIFNLIPVPPLDGSKILFAVLPYRWRAVESFLTRYQFWLVLFLLLLIANSRWLDVLVSSLVKLFAGATVF